MTLNEAINKRVSVRKFRELPMQTSELNNFMRGIEAIPNLFEQVYTESTVEQSSNLTFKVLTYAEATQKYSNLSKVCVYAPYYLFFYGDENSANYLSCGYIGQIASLWLTCNNFSACFQRTSKLIRAEQVKTEHHNDQNNKAISTGKTQEAEIEIEIESTKLRSEENSSQVSEEKTATAQVSTEQSGEETCLSVILAFGQAAQAGKSARKKLASRCLISGSPSPAVVLDLLLQSACQAPSEYNSQPWRFWTNDNTVHIFSQIPPLFISQWHQYASSVACGTLVANLATLAELKNLPYQIFCEQQAFADIQKLTYQLSFRLL